MRSQRGGWQECCGGIAFAVAKAQREERSPFARMALSCVLGIVLATLVLFPEVVQGESPKTPFKAYVTTDNAEVRSGPSEEYYPTERLPVGTQVEVFRCDLDGWYAIRPFRHSYSWISARDLEFKEDHLATVRGDRVPCCVGSRLTDQRDVVQVRLERGETVEVLDGVGRESPAGGWCRIAPPAGEFRWIAAKFVEADTRGADAERGQTRQCSGAADTDAPRWRKAAEPPAVIPAAAAAPASPAPAATVQTPPPSPIPPAVAPAAPVDPNAPPQIAPSALRQLSPEEFTAEFDAINMELSLMLAQDVATWNAEPLSRRTQALLLQAQSAGQRGQARQLDARITTVQNIQQRATGKTPATTAGRTPDAVSASNEPIRGRITLLPAGDGGGRFDGIGRLTRVMTTKVGAPSYALVDDKGKVVCYVMPAPGVNMQSYLGHRVGINGLRRDVTDHNAELLTAKRVTPLDSRTR